jgi:hypothetical protein
MSDEIVREFLGTVFFRTAMTRIEVGNDAELRIDGIRRYELILTPLDYFCGFR